MAYLIDGTSSRFPVMVGSDGSYDAEGDTLYSTPEQARRARAGLARECKESLDRWAKERDLEYEFAYRQSLLCDIGVTNWREYAKLKARLSEDFEVFFKSLRRHFERKGSQYIYSVVHHARRVARRARKLATKEAKRIALFGEDVDDLF